MLIIMISMFMKIKSEKIITMIIIIVIITLRECNKQMRVTRIMVETRVLQWTDLVKLLEMKNYLILIRLGFFKVVFSGRHGGINLTFPPVHIFRRTNLISI